jgi:flavin-dependent dehydrogenase
VIGGGLAGASAAIHLARGGKRPIVFEKERGAHHKVCGEFLSIEAQAHLNALGFDLQSLGGVPISQIRLVAGRKISEGKLPFVALGLTRKRLDDALLHCAEEAGAEVRRGAAIRRIEAGVLSFGTESFRPDAIFLATGKHELRGGQRDTAGVETNLIGFKCYYEVSAENREALSDFIEVILFDGGYAGLQLVETGWANLCLVADKTRFARADKKWENLFEELLKEPHLARRLQGATPRLEKPLTVSGIPYGFFHRAAAGAKNLYRLGDQAAVIPSFSGDGMSIALHSAELAAQSFLAGQDAHQFHRRLKRELGRQIRWTHGLQRLGFTGLGRRALVTLLGFYPGGLRHLAGLTRIAEPALQRAGVAHQ